VEPNALKAKVRGDARATTYKYSVIAQAAGRPIALDPQLIIKP
jgi:hypothetical protein